MTPENRKALSDFRLKLDSLLADFRQAHGTWRGISEPTPKIKAWLKSELEQ